MERATDSLKKFERLVAIGALILMALLILSSGSALAHTELVVANPASDSLFSVLPSQIELTFAENLLILNDKKISYIEVTSADGTRVDLENSRVFGRVLSVDLQSTEESGVFGVTWRAVSQDGHRVDGSYSFEVRQSESPVPSPTPSHSAPTQQPLADQGGDNPTALLVMAAAAILLTGWGVWFLGQRKN